METTILQFIESIRCPFLDVFFGALSLFGETIPLILLICLLYWLYDKDFGQRLVIVSFTSLCLNGFLKAAVARPRPYVSGAVSRVEIDSAFLSTTDLNDYQSFPSGHSQMSAGLFFTTAFRYQKNWVWILFPLLTLGVMCSRLYLGVHYPSDVLVGATLGIAFAYFWEFIFRKYAHKKYLLSVIFSSIAVILAFITPTKDMIELCACLIGGTIALPIENEYVKFQIQSGWKKKTARAGVGLLCVGAEFLFFTLLTWQSLFFKFLKYFFLVLTAALAVPYLFKKLKI